MRVGIGLPAAVPGTPASAVATWAAEGERAGFASLGVIDRLLYDNLDPLVALSAAAACTEDIELLTTVLNVVYRRNAVLLAKQLTSVDEISEGRLTAGLALGGWPDDYAASDVSLARRGAAFDTMLETMRRAWLGELTGASGPMLATPGRPRLLIGGLVSASFARVAQWGDGWVAPSFGMQTLTEGIAGVRGAWSEAGREGEPRVVVERYFCLGPDADAIADRYLLHYYGAEYLPYVRADTLTDIDQIEEELRRLSDAGCTDALLFPCSGGVEQVDLLAEGLGSTGGGWLDTARDVAVR